MVTATAQFTIVANTVSQADTAPNVGVNAAGGAGFNYPTFVPVQIPSPVPGKEARITNVSMPSIVLPNATFNIIVTFQTFIATQKNYTVHLTIPQLSLDHTSTPVSLANLARGSTIFTVTLPIQGGEAAEGASGIVTGQLDLLNTTDNATDDGTPISFRVQAPGDHDDSDHHIGIPPIVVPAVIPPAGPPDNDATVVILNSSNSDGDVDIDVHGFIPFEDVDLDLDIPVANKHDHQNKKADKDGHFSHRYHFTKDPFNIKQFIASLRTHGHSSNRSKSKTIDV